MFTFKKLFTRIITNVIGQWKYDPEIYGMATATLGTTAWFLYIVHRKLVNYGKESKLSSIPSPHYQRIVTNKKRINLMHNIYFIF